MNLQRLMITAAALAALSCHGAFAADRAADEKAVLDAEDRICGAYEKEDADGLNKLLDAHFTLTNSRSIVSTREEEVAELRSGNPTYDVFRNHDSSVRFYGDTAIVLGGTTVKGTSDGQHFEAEFQFTDVLVRDGKTWRIVAGHATRVPDKKPAAK